MLMNNLDALNLLTTPIWIVSPDSEEVLFANIPAQQLAAGRALHEMRTGKYSAWAQQHLAAYVPGLQNHDEIIEVWTVISHGEATTLSCKARLRLLDGFGEVIVFEGLPDGTTSGLKASRSAPYHPRKHGFYARFFYTNSAPILLIDPARDGLIVDANQAALRFYGYSYEAMCQRHTWEINTLGKGILPVMAEIARLPGGHKPLNFVHRLADGSTRHVQTYAGPVEIYNERLMLCIIHDITEQKRLEQELEYAAHRDALTGLLNRRQFYHLMEHISPSARDFSLLLIDADHFKRINDAFGHQKGDEVLIQLSRTLEQQARSGDFVFRWGGEEFLLLLPLTSEDAAMMLAEKIRLTLEALVVPGLPAFTVSIGVAHHQVEESLDVLFKRVDEALYRAKNDGRNKVLAA